MFAQDAKLDEMFEALRNAPAPDATRLGEDIMLRLSNSGSPAMNLLLKRGRDAMMQGDTALALELLGALTDHAPDFAEGWHARSVAYARAGLMGPAMDDLERSLALDPRNFAAIYSLGALLEEVGQPDLAAEAYAQVAAIHPHFDDVTLALERLKAEVRGTDL
ncbi:tetratricopeptide repeat protein [Pelagivirga sediminicola]|nr:tetratricopeptide repeat protein [Pelagivirga sediminicola]